MEEQKKGNFVISIKGETIPKMVFLEETPEYITEVVRFMTSTPTFMAIPTRYISSKNPARVIVQNPLHGIVVDVKSVSKEEAQKLISSLVKTVSGKNIYPNKNPEKMPAKVLPKTPIKQNLQQPNNRQVQKVNLPKQNLKVQNNQIKPNLQQNNKPVQRINIIKQPNQQKKIVISMNKPNLQKNNSQQKPINLQNTQKQQNLQNNQHKSPQNIHQKRLQIQKIVWQQKIPSVNSKPQVQIKPAYNKPQNIPSSNVQHNNKPRIIIQVQNKPKQNMPKQTNQQVHQQQNSSQNQQPKPHLAPQQISSKTMQLIQNKINERLNQILNQQRQQVPPQQPTQQLVSKTQQLIQNKTNSNTNLPKIQIKPNPNQQQKPFYKPQNKKSQS